MKSSTVTRAAFSTRTFVLALGAMWGGAFTVAKAQDARTPPPTYGAAHPDPEGGNARVVARRTLMEQRMRDMMTRSGISVPATQDAILEFLREDELSKRTVREAGRRLWNGIHRDVPAERLRALLSDYQKALEEAREGRVRSQTALDARVGYSLNARLESLLWLLGVLGEGQNILVLPAPPRPVNRITGGNVITADNAPGERQIEGVVNAKNAPDEPTVWLEVRDGAGNLWRMVPSTQPDAEPILSRQIAALTPGTRVSARVLLSPGADAGAPLSLLALVADTNDAQHPIDMDEQGAEDAPDGQ